MRYDPIICHRLMFAIRPPVEVIRRVGALFDMPGMAGRRVHAQSLHIAIDILEDSLLYPGKIVQAAARAGAMIELPPFDVVLDRLAGSHNTVSLRPSRRLPALQQLHEAVHRAGIDVGLPLREFYHFAPHMTFLFREGSPFTRPIEPIVWRVEQLILIDNLVGSARQDGLGEWVLKGPPERQTADTPRQYALL